MVLQRVIFSEVSTINNKIRLWLEFSCIGAAIFAICAYFVFDYLHGVLQLSQLGHNSNWICLSHFLLNFRIVYAHEDVMFLLVTYRELSLGFFVVVGEALQILHRSVLRNRYTEFDITFCIFVTGLYYC